VRGCVRGGHASRTQKIIVCTYMCVCAYVHRPSHLTISSFPAELNLVEPVDGPTLRDANKIRHARTSTRCFFLSRVSDFFQIWTRNDEVLGRC